MANEYQYEQFIELSCLLVPVFLSWFFVLYLCISRRRENPRGVVYIGLAILIQIANYILSIVPMFVSWETIKYYFWLQSQIRHGFHGLLSASVWILIARAVFPRRTSQHADLS